MAIEARKGGRGRFSCIYGRQQKTKTKGEFDHRVGMNADAFQRVVDSREKKL